jgi:prepilin-type N-terminal cleavage/methylation domain-containing protein
MTPRRITHRRGFTLLEIMLVLVITGILVAAIAAAINIHLRVSEAGRTEVEQAQLARVVLRRIGDDLRAAVPYVEPVESEAGATAAEIDAAIAGATSGSGGLAGGGASGGSTPSAGGSTSSGGSSSSSGSSGGSGVQTLQKLGTLSTLKPQSASSSSSGSSGGPSSGGTSGSGSSSSTGKTSSTGLDSEATEETTTATKPGIYGDQYSLQVDVSRVLRPGLALPSAGLDAPGDVKTVGYYVTAVPGATDALGQPVMGLYRQSFDKAVASFDASAGTTAGSAAQLLAEEVAAIEFRYFDGTTWQTSWDSSGGSLPTAVEVAITTLTHTNSPSGTITAPQTHRLTVAIPAAQVGASSSSTDTSTESTSSSSTETTP